MSTQPKNRITPEQYLEIDRKAEYKSEYFDGEMFAMSGGRAGHNQLGFNLISQLGPQLGHGPCRGYTSDMRVRVSPSGRYTYPDIVVVCGEPRFLDETRDTLLNPKLVVEVLSPSTEIYDRGLKFEYYQSIESLSEYLLIASERIRVDLYTRQSDGRWLLTSASSLGEVLELKSIGCSLSLSDLYAQVDFA